MKPENLQSRVQFKAKTLSAEDACSNVIIDPKYTLFFFVLFFFSFFFFFKLITRFGFVIL